MHPFPGRSSASAMFVATASTALLLTTPLPAVACDVCAIYTATELAEQRIGPRFGIAEQFTHFAKLQRDGEAIDNPNRERLNSSITQFQLGYQFTSALRASVNVPFLSRTFRRLEGDEVERGSERGVGDIALIGEWSPWSFVSETLVARITLLAGIELPSGNSDRLAEELEEGHHDEEGIREPDEHHDDEESEEGHHDLRTTTRRHGAEELGEGQSGVHGHDLARGSGSVDGIFGARVFGSWNRVFATGGFQYALRNEGDFDYAYADDITWSVAPGLFLWLEHPFTVGLQAMFTGEAKGKDTLAGDDLDDTAIDAVYAGPAIFVAHGSSFSLEVGGELPVHQDASAVQILPNWRIRSGLTWRF